MKRFFCVALVIGVIAVSFVPGPAQAAEEKKGILEPQETWEANEGPYRLTDHVIANDLTIEAGTVVEAQGDYLLTVTGTLTVEGEEGNPVVFNCKGTSNPCWKGIEFAPSQDGSDVEWAEISEAATGLKTNSGEWSITDSTFSGNETGANLTGAPGDSGTGDFEHNLVEDNKTGVRISGQVSNFTLNGISENDLGVDFRTTAGQYSENNIFDNETLDASSCETLGDEVDATDNYWGTTSENTISANMCDRTDSGQAGKPTIKFSPFEDAPVAGAAGAPAPPSPSPTVTTSPTAPPPPVEHSRSVTLSLKRHVRASGVVSVADGYVGCIPPTVTIRYKPFGGKWKAVKQPVVDSATGAYKARLADKKGMYQTSVGPSATDSDSCLAAVSPKVKHKHRK